MLVMLTKSFQNEVLSEVWDVSVVCYCVLCVSNHVSLCFVKHSNEKWNIDLPVWLALLQNIAFVKNSLRFK